MAVFKVSARRGGSSSSREAQSLIITVSGELDIATAPQFTDRFDEFLPEGLRHVLIDVSKLTFVDVTGLRAFAALRARAEQRRIGVRLSGVSPQMQRLMRIFSPTRGFSFDERKPEAADGQADARPIARIVRGGGRRPASGPGSVPGGRWSACP